MPNYTNKTKQDHGFGLIEMLVSIGIALLIMTVVMAKHSSSNGAVLLRSQAYEVALETREVQLAAVSPVGSNGNFRSSYGLFFDKDNPGYYLDFRDAGTINNFYDSGEEVGKRSNLDPRFEIGDIRLVTGGTESPINDIAIVFERPNFDAHFFTAPNTEAADSVNAVEIDIRVEGTSGAGLGEVRTVEISRTGQIIVQ
jgi:prepilin-type N-terminal cleavage/methylation domain-containing protein